MAFIWGVWSFALAGVGKSQVKISSTLWGQPAPLPLAVLYMHWRFNTSSYSKQLTTEQQQYLQEKYKTYMANAEPYLYQVISNPGFHESTPFRKLL